METSEEMSRMLKQMFERTKASCLSPEMVFPYFSLAKAICESGLLSELADIDE